MAATIRFSSLRRFRRCAEHVSFCLEIACLGVLELNFSASGEAAPAAEAQIQFSLYVMKVLRYLGAALFRDSFTHDYVIQAPDSSLTSTPQ